MWIIVYSSDYKEWQVSDGPVGERSCSYDFNTKEEAEKFLERLNEDGKDERLGDGTARECDGSVPRGAD